MNMKDILGDLFAGFAEVFYGIRHFANTLQALANKMQTLILGNFGKMSYFCK